MCVGFPSDTTTTTTTTEMASACIKKFKQSPENYVRHMLAFRQWTPEMLLPVMYDPTNTERITKKLRSEPSKLVWVYLNGELVAVYESAEKLLQDFLCGQFIITEHHSVSNTPQHTTIFKDFMFWANDIINTY